MSRQPRLLPPAPPQSFQKTPRQTRRHLSSSLRIQPLSSLSHPQRRQPLARGRAPNLSLSSPHLNGVMSLRRTAPPQFPHPIPLPPHTGHPVTRVNSQLHSGLILMQPPHGQWSGTLTPWIRPSCLPNACLLICVCASMSSSCNFLFILRYV